MIHYTTWEQNLARKNNMDLGIGKINIDLGGFMSQKDPFKMNIPKRRKGENSLAFDMGRAVGTARRKTRAVQSKFSGHKYQVLTIHGGVVRRHTFRDRNQAMAFREQSRASESYENISEITEMR